MAAYLLLFLGVLFTLLVMMAVVAVAAWCAGTRQRGREIDREYRQLCEDVRRDSF